QRVGGVAIADPAERHQVGALHRARGGDREGAPADQHLLGDLQGGRLRVVQVHPDLAPDPVRAGHHAELERAVRGAAAAGRHRPPRGARPYSRISTRVRLPVRGAAALTTERMARAVLPPRPMILPRSSSPTSISYTLASRSSTSETTTSSGWSTRLTVR